ncbi:glycosyltransferase family 39 protein [Geobacter sp. AOG1]|uniref:ArnT family glycosyltransferase n=1 Tax=Geobacter sp. AOG1 TaxID=1566346 RepID=UPI001CC6AB92|nr:glycosyltransferase family 39 protein [Geobacter sp. AOG1]GFE57827.1 hypothetical protein AOG1_17070 [Geobacter sp. AOG1]
MKERTIDLGRFVPCLQYIPLALVLAVVAYVRIRLLQVPLERDEGEYAYMGQLLLNGMPPYVHAYSMKLPGVSGAYALIMALFGQTPSGIHLGLILVNGLCVLFVYLLALRLFDRAAAFPAAASYAVLSLSEFVYGIFAHATHFVVLFSLAGFILLLSPYNRARTLLLFLSGFCFGLAFTMKQPAALLAVCALLHLAWTGYHTHGSSRKAQVTGFALFLFGLVVPYTLILIWVLKAGAFEKFWFWTVTYVREYASGQTVAQGLSVLDRTFPLIVKPHLPLWLLAGAGALFLMANRGRCTNRRLVAGLLFFSSLAVSSGFYFRWHYFILILPVIALLVGASCAAIEDIIAPGTNSKKWLGRMVPTLLVMAAIGYGLYQERSYFFKLTPLEASAATYGTTPFPAAIEIGRYIKDHTSGTDRIAVLGSEPEIYFYAGRLSATGYIYMYSLMEDQPHAERMQQELIREIEQSKPIYCVFTKNRFSWLGSPSSPRLIFSWFEPYAQEHYEQVGVIELYDSETRYFWDADAAQHTPGSESYLVVYKRKS